MLPSIQTEIDASFLYQLLADHEEDPIVAEVFRQMADIERGHALAFLKSNSLAIDPFPVPSWRAKVLSLIGRVFGYDYILGVLMDTEKRLASQVSQARRQYNDQRVSLSDNAHVAILKSILQQQPSVSGATLARFEKKHRSVGGNALRAAVLGGNDGLVSNFSLVMGVAGAAGGSQNVLMAGLAGLMAGALSMALGEWISVRSSQELYENQMAVEMEELEINPEGEEREMKLLYMAKGIPEQQAAEMAAELMKDKQKAHEFLVKEELGINSEELKGSAMEAAVTSFLFFAVGAVFPVVPFFFLSGTEGILVSTIVSSVGLFFIGAAITLFTGKNIWYSGFRQVLFGLVAAAITFGIGSLIGVELAG
jgi:VIT1/CCC1 family predicted Fe2+/Mn2+ transporter